MTGTLYGVGVGPGDPSLMTVRAVDLVRGADVVAYHCARHGRSNARAIVAQYLGTQVEEQLTYPVTTESTDDYQGALDAFYAEAAARLAAHLDAGRDVVVVAEGDPFFYGSYMHLHKRLADRYPTEVVPGVTSVAAAAAALGRPLVERDEVLTVLPGTLPPDELAARLAATDAAAVMKLGRTFTNVRAALATSGRLDEAHYVERASTASQRTAPLADVDPGSVPYFSVGLVPSRVHADTTPTARAETEAVIAGRAVGEVVVVGLGPGARDRLTPEASAALAAAEDVVGYTTYTARVPVNPRQRVHGSDNKVESERAAFALDLAQGGRRVAVVSSGDPGVFAMASAVVEVAAADYPDVPVRVVPGVSAAQAVAARVGAPLGHDYAMISLSDRLKPWDVVERRLAAVADADMAIALYNPASRSRTWQVEAARDLLLKYRDPSTPVVVGRDVDGPEESVRVVRLADLVPAEVDMRTLLIIGASTSRWPAPGTVYTPRRYG
ncbi:precorrin-2 C20-methyltransferase/precorrin-3B C17-methyltransferase [Actinomycetospora succinea]|uniref:Precorrin-2 C20-methyltransferase/precorrin-3B C17-methyltransferase n=1 Tax=Actinomycetospora succinea TaxID=663603 RepID=A0A4R6V446_9PSEU|nr:precorrin-2 C(20)-methyltransferase [Actinomycetospora succinea]TDQ50964.1 precorrin-2 C20-methyltransferase/precorrin-3B C17-methyltransferase [Actinomycetospora succinea]